MDSLGTRRPISLASFPAGCRRSVLACSANWLRALKWPLMRLQTTVKVTDRSGDLTAAMRRAAGIAIREAGRKAARAWQRDMLEQLEQAATDTEGGGSGRKYRSLTRRSRGKREHPARQSGDFAESWEPGEISVTMVGPLRAKVRASIDSSHERVLEIVAGSSDFFNDWTGPDESRRVFVSTYERALKAAYKRELRREGLA